MLSVLQEVIRTGFDLLMPVKRVRVNMSDSPWMTQHLKSIIMKRQKAFHQQGAESVQFKFYRNAVNRERKTCEAKFYKSQVENMKEEDPKVWWKEVKRLSGRTQYSSGNVINLIQTDGVENLSAKELANVNKAFLEPLEEYRLTQPLTKLPVDEDSRLYEVSEVRMRSLLEKLNPSKACGPDEIPNWLLREYADFLYYPVRQIVNASLHEQHLPKIWKMADVTQLPKTKPVKDLKKDLRPISLTACLSKVAEDCVVVDYVKPAVLKVLDLNQYGAVPNSSTTQALIHMIHHWAKETDGNGASVRTVLFDYRKAFDLIDHNILVCKLAMLDLPNLIINWIIDFLSDRFQRIKLADGCYSQWGSVPSGVPQGTKLGPWLFLVLINDLNLDACSDHECRIWKYVDDTTASEVVAKGSESNAQQIANRVFEWSSDYSESNAQQIANRVFEWSSDNSESNAQQIANRVFEWSSDNSESNAQQIANRVFEWSSDNRMKLNADKCKELRILFAKTRTSPIPPVIVNGNELEVVQHAKLLGVTISSDLSWNQHISDVVKKASKRLYFLVQLKRARVSPNDLVLFYVSCIRSVLIYAAPVFYFALPQYLQRELERVQKRALSIISPGKVYDEALEAAGVVPLITHIDAICSTFFQAIVQTPNHRLHDLLPRHNEPSYKWRTNRFKNTFIMSSSINYQHF